MFILIFQGFYLYFYDLYRKTGDREDFEKIISDHADAAGNVSLFNNTSILHIHRLYKADVTIK